MREQSPTRIELEKRLRELIGATNEMKSSAATASKASGVAVGFLAALMAFLWGRRRGRRRHS